MARGEVLDRWSGRLSGVRTRVRGLPGGRLGWRIGVTFVGVLVIVGGVVLLPLPGPGWLIIFAGMGVLATEYAWAARLLRWARDRLAEWTRWVAARPRWVQVLIGVAVFVVVVAVIGAVWWVVYR